MQRFDRVHKFLSRSPNESENLRELLNIRGEKLLFSPSIRKNHPKTRERCSGAFQGRNAVQIAY